MSQENVEVVRRGIDAWNRGDPDEWLAGFAPEAELQTTGRFVDRGVYRGRTGLALYWAELHEDTVEISLSITDMRAIDDRVFYCLMASGRGKRSGVPVEGPLWFVATFRDGLVMHIESYASRADALEAAGLSE